MPNPIPIQYLCSENPPEFSAFTPNSSSRLLPLLESNNISIAYCRRGRLLYQPGAEGVSSEAPILFRVMAMSPSPLLPRLREKVLQATAKLRERLNPPALPPPIELPPHPPEKVALIRTHLDRLRETSHPELTREIAHMMAVVLGVPAQWFQEHLEVRNLDGESFGLPLLSSFILESNRNSHSYPLNFPLIQVGDPRSHTTPGNPALIFSPLPYATTSAVPAVATFPAFFLAMGNSPPNFYGDGRENQGGSASDEVIEDLFPGDPAMLDSLTIDLVSYSSEAVIFLLRNLLSPAR